MVKEVDRGSVGGAAPEGGESLKAAAGADRDDRLAGLAQHDIEGGVVAARETKIAIGAE